MPISIEKISGRALLPFDDAEDFLKSELVERLKINLPCENFGKLLYFKNFPKNSLTQNSDCEKNIFFARTQMLEPFLLRFESIGEAAAALKSIQRNWASYQFQFFRRAELIQKKLPYINFRERDFPVKIPRSEIGLWTLLDERTILASAKTSSFLPAGKIVFKENHIDPPSRAYLKLQEAFALANNFFGVEFPGEGTRCFEAGAAPGGWTWVLANLGANILAVDRAELDWRLMKNKRVEFLAHDAFTLSPEEIGKCDWVFSDVICYPERLLEWTRKWLESGLAKNMICTIKMQGGINWSAVEKFEAIENSRVVHLNYNKHELTWIHCEPSLIFNSEESVSSIHC